MQRRGSSELTVFKAKNQISSFHSRIRTYCTQVAYVFHTFESFGLLSYKGPCGFLTCTYYSFHISDPWDSVPSRFDVRPLGFHVFSSVFQYLYFGYYSDKGPFEYEAIGALNFDFGAVHIRCH